MNLKMRMFVRDDVLYWEAKCQNEWDWSELRSRKEKVLLLILYFTHKSFLWRYHQMMQGVDKYLFELYYTLQYVEREHDKWIQRGTFNLYLSQAQ